MPLRVFTDSRCLRHEVPRGFPEVPVRLQGVLREMRQVGLEVEEAGEHAGAMEAILAVHPQEYLDRLRAAVRSGELFIDTGDNPLSEGTWEAARAAVDACLFAADWIATADGRAGFAAVRPPGHHAERSMAMGFCYLNNVAIAAEYLLRQHGLARVAIVDFDVHHGNGTQHLFEDRGDVLYVSPHQHPLFPGTGLADERGRGAGHGATVNIPLPAGSGDERYGEVFAKVILPAVRDFGPNALLVSAGFDAWKYDPVGGMRVTSEAFGEWGGWLQRIANDLCRGRVLMTLEGGYDLQSLGPLAVACCQGMLEAQESFS